jgi:hypothetical protein
VTAVATLSEIVVNPMAAWLMRISPWLTMSVGMALLSVGLGLTAIIPETLDLRKAAEEQQHHQVGEGDVNGNDDVDDSSSEDGGKQSAFQAAFRATKRDMLHVWQFIINSKTTSLLLFSYALAYLAKFIKIELLLQYITKRYNWTWDQVSQYHTLRTMPRSRKSPPP